MITAKEARTLYYKHKERMKEADDFLKRLEELIKHLSYDGKTTAFLKCRQIEI